MAVKKKIQNTKRKKGAKYKATKETVEKRINKITELILSNKESDIVNYCERYFKISRTQSFKYKDAAYKRLNKIHNKSIEKNSSQTLSQLDKLYQEAETVTEKINILKEKAKITGIYAESKVQHSGEINYILDTKDIEI